MNVLLICFVFTSTVIARCYEPSPSFTWPEYDAKHPLLRSAFAAAAAALDATISGPEFNTTSFSIDVTSSKASLWSKHHTARERNASRPGVDRVDGDSAYRIASITKVFTVLGVLQQHAAGNLSLDDPITKYVKELGDERHRGIRWKDITLRSLASQLSGIPREFAQSDLWNSLGPDAVNFGLPPISGDELPKCDEYAEYTPPCNQTDLLRILEKKVPLFAPNQKSTYSNIAFELLGLAIENVTGSPYASYLQQAIFDPLGLDGSSISKPPDSRGVIPKGTHYWDVDEGVQNPTGGIYSTSNDLSKFNRFVLNHHNNIIPALNWLHPVSYADGMQNFYGMPWEIYRNDRILAHSKRPVNIATKSGGLPGYASIILLFPDYGIGITILAAGNFDQATLVRRAMEILTTPIIQAAEGIAIAELQERYKATYRATDARLNSSVTLKADHRGLLLSEFISNGTDVISAAAGKFFPAPTDRAWYVQLIPTLQHKNATANDGEVWLFLVVEEHAADDGTQEIWDEFCITDVDMLSYAGISINEMVFWKGKGGKMEGLEVSSFRVKLEREEEKGNERVAKEFQVPLLN